MQYVHPVAGTLLLDWKSSESNMGRHSAQQAGSDVASLIRFSSFKTLEIICEVPSELLREFQTILPHFKPTLYLTRVVLAMLWVSQLGSLGEVSEHIVRTPRLDFVWFSFLPRPQCKT